MVGEQSMASGREKSVPSTISDQAAELLRELEPDSLGADTTEAWRAIWEATEEAFQDLNAQAVEQYPATIDRRSIAGVDHLFVTPSTHDDVEPNRILVYVHGGAHTVSTPESMLIGILPAAHFTRSQVLAVRYPLAWQAPHPASRDTVIAVYGELLESYSPQRVAIAGDSAGAALVMSAVLKARDDGMPLPAALALLSPWADVTKTGDSLTLLEGADPTLDYEGNLRAPARLYATGQDLRDPSISPLYADFERGFPPSYISSGTRDLFLSHCARLQRKLLDAGIDNQLVVHEGMWHVFQAYPLPESESAWRDMAAFLGRHWAHVRGVS